MTCSTFCANENINIDNQKAYISAKTQLFTYLRLNVMNTLSLPARSAALNMADSVDRNELREMWYYFFQQVSHICGQLTLMLTLLCAR